MLLKKCVPLPLGQFAAQSLSANARMFRKLLPLLFPGRNVSASPDKSVTRFPTRCATRCPNRIASRFPGKFAILNTGKIATQNTERRLGILQNRNVTRCPDRRLNTRVSKNVRLSLIGSVRRYLERNVTTTDFIVLQ